MYHLLSVLPCWISTLWANVVRWCKVKSYFPTGIRDGLRRLLHVRPNSSLVHLDLLSSCQKCLGLWTIAYVKPPDWYAWHWLVSACPEYRMITSTRICPHVFSNAFHHLTITPFISAIHQKPSLASFEASPSSTGSVVPSSACFDCWIFTE